MGRLPFSGPFDGLDGLDPGFPVGEGGPLPNGRNGGAGSGRIPSTCVANGEGDSRMSPSKNVANGRGDARASPSKNVANGGAAPASRRQKTLLTAGARKGDPCE